MLADVETPRISLSSLVTVTVPKQLSWHIRGFVNLGGTKEELLKALGIAKSIVDIVGVKLKHPMPGVIETIKSIKLVRIIRSRVGGVASIEKCHSL